MVFQNWNENHQWHQLAHLQMSYLGLRDVSTDGTSFSTVLPSPTPPTWKGSGTFLPWCCGVPLARKPGKQWGTLKSKWSMPRLKLGDVGANLPLPNLFQWEVDGRIVWSTVRSTPEDYDRRTSHLNMVEIRALCNFRGSRKLQPTKLSWV